MLGAPRAGISLVDERREFLKSELGLGEPWHSAREIPLSHSLSKYVVASGNLLLVEDPRAESRLMDHPAFSELGLGAYLGVAVQVEGAASLGALWVADDKPHHWSDRDQELLRELAGLVGREIGLASMLRLLQRSEQIHKALVEHMPDIITELTKAERALREKSSLLESILEAMEESVVVCDREGKPVMFNESGRRKSLRVLGSGRERPPAWTSRREERRLPLRPGDPLPAWKRFPCARRWGACGSARWSFSYVRPMSPRRVAGRASTPRRFAISTAPSMEPSR